MNVIIDMIIATVCVISNSSVLYTSYEYFRQITLADETLNTYCHCIYLQLW